MDRKKQGAVFLIFIFVFFSCAAQGNLMVFPAPDKSLYENEKSLEIENITGSRDMGREPRLPDWLSAYLGGGIEEAEKIGAYAGKYLFVAANQGTNFASLSKWADNFSVERDFPMFAAARIERRMNVSNSIYPDDEFGIFYETFVRSAYNGEYQGAVKEDTYWIRAVTGGNGGGERESAASPEVFIFFVLISIDTAAMQDAVFDFFSQAFVSSAPSGARTAAINRLRQNFFEGF